MTSPINTDHYRYTVTWSEPDGAYVGSVAEFPKLSTQAADHGKALTQIRKLVSETVDDMLSRSVQPPLPRSEKEYSGNFVVRSGPDLHSRLAADAERRDVSLNNLVLTFVENGLDAGKKR